VLTLVHESQDAGNHQVLFNASGLESGVYYYRLQSGDIVNSRRFTILK
jgi:hypothetical protein